MRGKNPWLTMWVRPKATIRAIVDRNPCYGLWALSWFYGFVMLLQTAQNMSLGNSLSMVAIIILALVFAAPLGWLSFFVMGWILTWCGSWIGGKAKFPQVRAALAWSNVTSIVNVVLWALMLIGFGSMMFHGSFPSEIVITPEEKILAVVVFTVQSVVAIWSIVLLLKSLGEVQGFSIWKALLNVILPFMLIFFIMWIIGSLANLGTANSGI